MVKSKSIKKRKRIPLKRKRGKKIRRRRNINRWRIYVRRFSKFVKYILAVVGVVTIIFISHKFFIQSELFVVKEIQINGTHSFVNSHDLKTLAERKLLGKNIFGIQSDQLSSALHDSFQGAKTISVGKKYPDTVIINVYERVPLALVTNDGGERYYMVDEEGYVLGFVDEERTNLPKINYIERLAVGTFIDKDLIPLYVELLDSLHNERLKASTVSVKSKSINFYLNDNVEVFISREKDVRSSVKIMSGLLKQLGIEGKEVSRIDLRFDKVIVE